MGSRSGFVDIQGGRLFYRAAGRGTPLVFLHGGLTDHRMWDDQFHVFSSFFSVIRCDLRGFGRSSTPDHAFFPHQDLETLLSNLGIDSAYLVGMSMGSALAVDMALEHPRRVRGLVLAAPSLHGYEYSNEMTAKGTELFFLAFDKSPRTAVRRLFEDPFWGYTIPDSASEARRLRSMAADFFRAFRWDPTLMKPADPPASGRLSSLSAPALIVAAGADHPDNLAVARLLKAEIRGARLAEIHGACHMLNMERPGRFNRLVLEFLFDLEGEERKR